MERFITPVLIACLTMALIIAGCTSIPSTAPATTIATQVITVSPTQVPVFVSGPITDPKLQGTWFLKQMGEQGGAAPVLMTNTQMSIIFDGAGNFQGSTGCNNYNGQYTLTGQQMFSGMGMTIGSFVTTKKNCPDSANTETTYYQILLKTTSYVVNSNGELTLTDITNSNLVYTKNPVAPMPGF